MAVSNKEFWELWKQGEYHRALDLSMEEEERIDDKRLEKILFGSREQMQQTTTVTALSAGEFLYDYCMINPEVVKGIDFARVEDFSSVFAMKDFAQGIDVTVNTGNTAQLQGYAAEQIHAMELRAKGHEVEFPAEANNPGWDILVDDQKFQVKNLGSPAGVYEHLERYPDIPVYVNKELGDEFADFENVYVSNVSHAEVLESTKKTVSIAGEDLWDFEIPIIAAATSAAFNTKKFIKKEVELNQAVINVVSDTSSRVLLAGIGKQTGLYVGAFVFGPAGAITGAMLGTVGGAGQAGRLSSQVKRLLAKRKEAEVVTAALQLLDRTAERMDKKLSKKKEKFKKIDEELSHSAANDAIRSDFHQRFEEEKAYTQNKKSELMNLSRDIQSGNAFVMDQLSAIMTAISKTGVHPGHYQEELLQLQQAVEAYKKKL